MSCSDHLYRNLSPKEVSRRWFLRQCSVGLGSIAFAQLLAERGYAETTRPDPLAPKQPQFAPKAKRVIFLFMAGAPATWSCSTTNRNWQSLMAPCRRPNS